MSLCIMIWILEDSSNNDDISWCNHFGEIPVFEWIKLVITEWIRDNVTKRMPISYKSQHATGDFKMIILKRFGIFLKNWRGVTNKRHDDDANEVVVYHLAAD